MQNSLNKVVGLDLLSKYKYVLSDIEIRFIQYKINTIGLLNTIEYYLDEFSIERHPFLQSIDIRYNCTIVSFHYCLDLACKDNLNLKCDYINRLVAIHKANMEYEILNPPKVYEKKKKLLNTKSVRTTTSKKPKADKPAKEKLKARLTIVNLENNKEVTLDRELALSVVRDKPHKFKIKDD